MTQKLKVAAAQMEPRLMQVEDNLQTMERYVKEAGSQAVELLVFPECSLTGYMFDSREEAVPFAESVPGPGTERMAALSRSHSMYVAFGLLERADGWLFNTLVLLGPEGDMWSYRKKHLPFQGVDRFV
ncbi:MAG: carbon-nitrogen hydrolase family protein, partial [Chloroflexota bacterium]